MKKLLNNFTIKITAFVLAVIIFIATAFMLGFSILIFMISDGMPNIEYAQSKWAESYLRKELRDFSDILMEKVIYQDDVSLKEWASDKNYYYTIFIVNEENSLDIYDRNNYDYKTNYSYYETEVHEIYNPNINDYDVYKFEIDLDLKKNLAKKDIYYVVREIINICFDELYYFITFGIINIFLIIFLIIYLICAAGHKKGSDTPQKNLLDKIPFDIYTVMYIFLGWLEVGSLDILYYRFSETWAYAVSAIYIIVDYILILSYILSVSTRIKTKSLIKNTIVYRLLSFVFKYLKIPLNMLVSVIRSIPLIPKTAIVTTLIFLLNWGLLASWNENDSLILLFVEGIILIPIFFYFVICLKKLQNAGQRIAMGDLEHKVDTAYMIADFKEYGETLNNIGDGLSKAVNEKIKSERLKTELITNVSHDIKTPLTSIINYVDLIKKEEPQNENVRDYIDILDRQSNRLKKLIEDLIEASKASTGNISVEKEPCDLGILLSQTVGEFDERLKRKNLDIIVGEYKEQLTVMADRRHLWRVFDNLMSNICKYSQNGTRVYLTLNKIDNQAVITFRNISENQLYVSGDELTERFVRGDSSRNTEGSGLGLSIAKSLVELQGGVMQIHIDGDLFKVVISFKTEEH